MPQVTVACKIPMGLVLQVGDKKVSISGPSDPNGVKGVSHLAVAGYGLTVVDKEFWDAWHKDHKDYEPVKAGLLFAHERPDSAKSEAKEKLAVPSGMDRIDPSKPGKNIERATSVA